MYIFRVMLLQWIVIIGDQEETSQNGNESLAAFLPLALYRRRLLPECLKVNYTIVVCMSCYVLVLSIVSFRRRTLEYVHCIKAVYVGFAACLLPALNVRRLLLEYVFVIQRVSVGLAARLVLALNVRRRLLEYVGVT